MRTAYNNYTRPELTDSDEDGMGIRLEQARHPCVELQENVEYIPNDVELIFGESSFLILTGPNVSNIQIAGNRIALCFLFGCRLVNTFS